MSIRCIVLDMDRTTLNKEGKLSEENRAAITGAIEKGVEVVIGSGRSFVSLPKDVTGIPGIRYAITSNGASVQKIPSGDCLVRHVMEPESVDAVLSAVSDKVEDGITAIEVLTDGVPHCSAKYYADPMKYGASKQGSDYIRSTRRPVEDILGFTRGRRDDIECIDVVVNGQKVKAQLWQRFKNEVTGIYMTSSFDRLIEISDKESGKHSAVRYLLEFLGIRREETAAFGDGDNDAEMLAFVGAGVAVENATELCKSSADFITAAHYDDGVAKWIREVMPGL